MQYMPPPKPSLNGGLYTGEPFAKDAPWANVPVVPDVGYMIHYNLRSAQPPMDALTQYPGNNRPGNNYQPMPGVSVASAEYGLMCNGSCGANGVQPCDCKRCKFSKYYYL